MGNTNVGSIGQRIAHVRGSESQAAFARRLEVHKNTLGYYERGERAPDSNFLAKLAETGVNVHWVVTGEGPVLLSELGTQVGRPGTFNRDRLFEVVEVLEEVLEERDVHLAPRKMAELVVLVYEEITEQEEEGARPDREKIVRLVRLAS